MKKLIILFLFALCAMKAYADTSIKLPVELLSDVAKSVEFKAARNVIQRILLNQVLKNTSVYGIKLKDFSIENLIEYFNSDGLFKKIGKNKVVEPNTGATLEFNSDGKCKGKECTITVDLNGDRGPNEVWKNASDPKDRLIFIIKRDKNNGITVITPELN